ncbi:hypothetical protein HDU76_001556 [Blyttiomyces sp. JEL0837]|nr:hypothetical protein HDU76_001556 [Blyttiomyces sp. JEL0837]
MPCPKTGSWPETKQGQSISVVCPSGKTGFGTVKCSYPGVWQTPDYSSCVDLSKYCHYCNDDGAALYAAASGADSIYSNANSLIKNSYTKEALQVGTDGNLVLEDKSGTGYWSTGTSGQGPYRLTMQSDGNLVLFQSNGALWSTQTSASPVIAVPHGDTVDQLWIIAGRVVRACLVNVVMAHLVPMPVLVDPTKAAKMDSVAVNMVTAVIPALIVGQDVTHCMDVAGRHKSFRYNPPIVFKIERDIVSNFFKDFRATYITSLGQNEKNKI